MDTIKAYELIKQLQAKGLNLSPQTMDAVNPALQYDLQQKQAFQESLRAINMKNSTWAGMNQNQNQQQQNRMTQPNVLNPNHVAEKQTSLLNIGYMLLTAAARNDAAQKADNAQKEAGLQVVLKAANDRLNEEGENQMAAASAAQHRPQPKPGSELEEEDFSHGYNTIGQNIASLDADGNGIVEPYEVEKLMNFLSEDPTVQGEEHKSELERLQEAQRHHTLMDTLENLQKLMEHGQMDAQPASAPPTTAPTPFSMKMRPQGPSEA